MRVSASAFAVAALAVVVSAQSTVPSYNSSLEMEIDPQSVTASERARFCRGQTNGCRALCGGSASPNNCDAATLEWDCLCTSNSSVPGLQYYANTMPSQICQTLFGQCNDQNIGNADNQEACITNIRDNCDPDRLLATPDPSGNGGDEDEDGGSEQTSTTTSAPSSTTTDSQETEDEASTSSSEAFAAPTLSPAGNGAAVAAALGMLAYLI